MPKGAMVRSILESFIKDELVKRGYEPVYTPHIGRLELYRTSGHFPYYRDAQFPPMFFNYIAGALDLAHYRLAAVRRHPQFTHVDDIVSFNARMLEETVSNAAYSLVTV